jgi:hypothetical protein
MHTMIGLSNVDIVWTFLSIAFGSAITFLLTVIVPWRETKTKKWQPDTAQSDHTLSPGWLRTQIKEIWGRVRGLEYNGWKGMEESERRAQWPQCYPPTVHAPYPGQGQGQAPYPGHAPYPDPYPGYALYPVHAPYPGQGQGQGQGRGQGHGQFFFRNYEEQYKGETQPYQHYGKGSLWKDYPKDMDPHKQKQKKHDIVLTEEAAVRGLFAGLGASSSPSASSPSQRPGDEIDPYLLNTCLKMSAAAYATGAKAAAQAQEDKAAAQAYGKGGQAKKDEVKNELALFQQTEKALFPKDETIVKDNDKENKSSSSSSTADSTRTDDPSWENLPRTFLGDPSKDNESKKDKGKDSFEDSSEGQL